MANGANGMTNGTHTMSNGHYGQNGQNGTTQPRIKLYTNHGCPYAHRAHIALKELDLPYEEVIIDLEKPREQWYLDLNPRGLVPTIEYSDGILNNEIVTESAIVAQFLADLKPSHLSPASNESPQAALLRARIAYFVDTWSTKISSALFPILFQENPEDKVTKALELVQLVGKEMDPLLKDANPFFGGHKQMTMAEVQIASFVVRAYAMSDGELLPLQLKEGLDALPNFSRWAHNIMSQESVLYTFNPEKFNMMMKRRIGHMRTIHMQQQQQQQQMQQMQQAKQQMQTQTTS